MHASVGQRILFGLVVAGGVWAAWNGVGFALDSSTRHRTEAAWFIFAAVLLIAGFSPGRQAFTAAPDPVPGRHALQKAAPLILIACSLLLYAPVLAIGLLSDDFVLLQRVRDGALIDPAWDYVRPLPLSVWRAITAVAPAGSVPMALHAFNAVVHGVNAWLVLVCALRMPLPARVGWGAAFLFLASPFAVETVTWASGVFDAMLTLFVLTSVAVVLSDRLSFRARILLVTMLTASAAASKETAIAQPLLLALVIPFVPRDHRRAAWWSTVAAATVLLVYVGWRLGAGFAGAPAFPASGYEAKELLSRPFGALGFGIHTQVLEAVPLLGPMVAVGWPVIFVAAAWKWQRDPRLFRFTVLGAAWVLASTLPLMTTFFVSDDLQASRYLYLGATMWSIAIVTMIAGGTGRMAPAINAVVILLVLSAAALVLAHQRPWRRAAHTRDRVLAALAAVPRDCAIVPATLPDHEAGAYVFRNGFHEATALLNRGAAAASASPSCTAAWQGSAFEVKE